MKTKQRIALVQEMQKVCDRRAARRRRRGGGQKAGRAKDVQGPRGGGCHEKLPRVWRGVQGLRPAVRHTCGGTLAA
jgi:hypothetical protein